jgi:hypothetical protein
LKDPGLVAAGEKYNSKEKKKILHIPNLLRDDDPRKDTIKPSVETEGFEPYETED